MIKSLTRQVLWFVVAVAAATVNWCYIGRTDSVWPNMVNMLAAFGIAFLSYRLACDIVKSAAELDAMLAILIKTEQRNTGFIKDIVDNVPCLNHKSNDDDDNECEGGTAIGYMNLN